MICDRIAAGTSPVRLRPPRRRYRRQLWAGLNRIVAAKAGRAYGWVGPQGSIKAWQGMARLHRQQRLAVAYLQQVEALSCVFLKRRFLVG